MAGQRVGCRNVLQEQGFVGDACVCVCRGRGVVYLGIGGMDGLVYFLVSKADYSSSQGS